MMMVTHLPCLAVHLMWKMCLWSLAGRRCSGKRELIPAYLRKELIRPAHRRNGQMFVDVLRNLFQPSSLRIKTKKRVLKRRRRTAFRFDEERGLLWPDHQLYRPIFRHTRSLFTRRSFYLLQCTLPRRKTDMSNISMTPFCHLVNVPCRSMPWKHRSCCQPQPLSTRIFNPLRLLAVSTASKKHHPLNDLPGPEKEVEWISSFTFALWFFYSFNLHTGAFFMLPKYGGPDIRRRENNKWADY